MDLRDRIERLRFREGDAPDRKAVTIAIETGYNAALDDVLELLADIPRPQESEKCPHCHEGSNSRAEGGTDRCFHCDTCGYIGCMWTAAEKERMLAKLAKATPPRPEPSQFCPTCGVNNKFYGCAHRPTAASTEGAE